MPTLTIHLPVKNAYHEDNRNRWEEILRDQTLANYLGKIETNRHGQILMMPSYSEKRFATVKDQSVFEMAPEICVEVVSPSNTETELDEKKELYFEAGAEEVWFCNGNGEMFFFARNETSEPMVGSRLCPGFPDQIEN